MRLIVCVDRDDDLGRKTGIKGPVVGRAACMKAAIALATADPRDTDANTIFETVKTYDEFTKDGHKAKVAVLTGDGRVGIKSDEEVVEQLKKVMKGIDGIIFVSDGLDDEQLIPIIQSYGRIVSIKRVVVKQAERLESMYYTILDFIKRVMRDKELSKLIIGVPGIAALIYAVLGADGWRLIVGITGVYMVIKGLQLESFIDGVIQDVRVAIKQGNPSFFVYVIALLLALVGTASALNAWSSGIAESIRASDFIFLSSALAFFLAKALNARDKKQVLDYVTSGLLLALVVWSTDSVVSIMAEGSGVGLIITPIFLGLALMFAVLITRRLIKKRLA